MGVQSAGSKDAEGGAVLVAVHFVAVVVAAAVSDSEVESMPPVKQVEVGTVVPAIPMNSDPKPMSAKEEAAAVAAVGFESGAAGPILRSDQPWKKLLGGWSYSIAAIAESTVAAEDWKCQEATSHLQVVHYYSCLLPLPPEQHYHDEPQTMNHCRPTDDYYLWRVHGVEPVDQRFARSCLQLHHPWTFAASLRNGNAGVLLSSVSISPYL